MVLFEVKKYLKYFPSTATDEGSFGSGSLDLGDGDHWIWAAVHEINI
jgi:hypothetical protein